MDAQASCQIDTRGAAPTAQIRELTIKEVDEVAGGIIPLAAVAVAVLVAATIQEVGDAASESEDSDSGDGDD